MTVDPTLARIGQGVQLHHGRGERAAARDLFGDPGRAREHLRRARDGIGVLGDDEYGRLIRDGLDRLTRLLTPGRPR